VVRVLNLRLPFYPIDLELAPLMENLLKYPQMKMSIFFIIIFVCLIFYGTCTLIVRFLSQGLNMLQILRAFPIFSSSTIQVNLCKMRLSLKSFDIHQILSFKSTWLDLKWLLKLALAICQSFSLVKHLPNLFQSNHTN
jgi:hypothetical protein